MRVAKNTKHLLAAKMKQPNGVHRASVSITEGTIHTGTIWQSECRKTSIERIMCFTAAFTNPPPPPVCVCVFVYL